MANHSDCNNKMTIFESAQQYLSFGWSIMPLINGTKNPSIKWKELQGRQLAPDEVERYFKDNKMGMGLICGNFSGIIVIDLDLYKEHAKIINLETPVKVRTGGGGLHGYFRYKKGTRNSVNKELAADIRGEGGYVVLPPSIHPNGNEYRWEIKDGLTLKQAVVQIPELSDDLLAWMSNDKLADGETRPYEKFDLASAVNREEGSRDDTINRAAWALANKYSPEEAWVILRAINQTYRPPLDEKIVQDKLERAYAAISEEKELKKNVSGNEKKSGTFALRIVEKIKEGSTVFFHDQNKESYAATNGDGREILRLRSRAFKQYVAHFVYENFKRVVPTNTLSDVIQMLEGKAIFDGSQYNLYARIVKQDNTIWYDLGDGSAVFVSKDGWNINETPPILFRRFSHQQLQIRPQLGGNLKDLCGFINLSTENQKLLFLVYTVAAFIPDFPHPILVLYGPQGAGKSTPQRLLKSLIDPSVIKTLSSPDSIREFVQLASHNYFLFLDNLSSLRGWLSDSLARACTGDGFTKRELFSDDDDIIYSFQRTICLNGINLVIQRADLLERSILISLERISKDKRREEQEFWQEFEKQKPYLLGAIFEAVAGSLREYSAVHLTLRPRMADFARWGCAIAKALGYQQEDFLEAYQENIGQQNEAALEASSVATVIIALMAEREKWEGTASDLLAELETKAEQIKINTKAKDWPNNPSWLSRGIQQVITNLAEDGIKITRDEKSRPKRILIQKVVENTDNVDMSSDIPKSEAKSDPTPPTQLSFDGDKNADKADGRSGQVLSTPTPLTAYSEEVGEEDELDVDF